MARALALVDGVRCELVTFGREARVEEHDGLRIHVLRAVGHLGGHSAHPVAPVTPGDELVLMWVEREHRLAVGLPDTGIAVSERVVNVPSSDSMRSSSGTPGSISPRYASSSLPPLIPEKCVVTTTSSGPGSGSATAATRT